MIELDADQCAQVLGVKRRTFLEKYTEMPDCPKESTYVTRQNRKWPRDGILRFKVRLLEIAQNRRAAKARRRLAQESGGSTRLQAG